MMIPTYRSLLSALVLTPLVACGGGNPLPTAQVGVPASGTVTDASSITVSGKTAPGPAAIAMVRVEGVDATTTDDYTTWSAEVPLNEGRNSLDIEIEDVNGEVFDDTAEVVVRRRPLFIIMSDLDIDATMKLGWALDGYDYALYSFDVTDGEVDLITSDDRGTGPLFGQPTTIAAVAGSATVYVADTQLDVIFEVETLTGDRTPIPVTGDPIGNFMFDLEIDPVSGVLYLVTGNGVFTVDPVSGVAKNIAPDGDATNGPLLENPRDVAIDPTTGAVYVATPLDIQQVDPSSGKRKAVSMPPAVGKGQAFLQIISLDIDPNTGTLYVIDNLLDAMLAVDPDSGDRTVIRLLEQGIEPADFVLDPANEALLVSDNESRSILSYGLDGSGPRMLVTNNVGRGPAHGELRELAFGASRCFAIDTRRSALMEIDTRNGNRAELSGDLVGGGDIFSSVEGLALDIENGRAYVSETSNGVITAVDLATGDRTTVAEGGQVDGFEDPEDIALLPDGRLVVMDGTRGLYLLDPSTGVQRVLSITGDGQGVDFRENLGRMRLDLENDRVLVCDYSSTLSGVKAVGLSSGTRTPLFAFAGENYPVDAPGLALDEARGLAYFGVRQMRQIYVIDLEQGGATLVAAHNREQGLELDSLLCLELDAENGQLLTYSRRHGALLGVSLESGDRVILSK